MNSLQVFKFFHVLKVVRVNPIDRIPTKLPKKEMSIVHDAFT